MGTGAPGRPGDVFCKKLNDRFRGSWSEASGGDNGCIQNTPHRAIERQGGETWEVTQNPLRGRSAQ